MDIIKTNALTKQQIAEILELQKESYRKNKLKNYVFLSNDINFDQRIPCFFMGYVGARLVCFLTIFMPSRTETEVMAFTHPDYRDKGCFTLLLDEARSVLRRAKIAEILFAVEPTSRTASAVLKKLGCFGCERSEYRMSVSNLNNAPNCDGIKVFEVDHSNKELFRSAISAVFPGEQDMDNFYNAVVASDMRRGYILYTDRPIGIFNLNLEHGGAMLYGVGIAPEFRHNGYGSKLMGYAMREGLRLSDSIALDVDSDNATACHLYKKCGFKVAFQIDYYRYIL